MTIDVEFAEAFYTHLESGYADYIENAYETYRSYMRNIKAQNYVIPFDWELELKVEEDYRKWKNKEG